MSSATKSRANAELAVPRKLLFSYLEEAKAQLARRRAVVGTRIREAREAKRLLQKELALRVHVEPQTISNWERGVTAPDFDKLELLGLELDQPVAYFLVSDDDERTGPPASQAQIQEVLEAVSALRGDVEHLREHVEALREEQPQATQGRRRGR